MTGPDDPGQRVPPDQDRARDATALSGRDEARDGSSTPDEATPVAERLEATVLGAVQGVGFRWFVLQEAARLELRGWSRTGRTGPWCASLKARVPPSRRC